MLRLIKFRNIAGETLWVRPEQIVGFALPTITSPADRKPTIFVAIIGIVLVDMNTFNMVLDEINGDFKEEEKQDEGNREGLQ